MVVESYWFLEVSESLVPLVSVSPRFYVYSVLSSFSEISASLSAYSSASFNFASSAAIKSAYLSIYSTSMMIFDLTSYFEPLTSSMLIDIGYEAAFCGSRPLFTEILNELSSFYLNLKKA